MPPSRFRPTAIALFLAAAAQAQVPVNTTVDPVRSSVTVTLTLTGTSDADTSPASGVIDVILDDAGMPTALSLTDFDVQLDETIDLAISFGFLGSFSATGSGVSLFYTDAPTPVGPAPIAGGMVLVPDVPLAQTGLIDYLATGLVCTSLQSSGLACAATIDLSTFPATPGGVDGTVEITGSTLTLTSTFAATQPLDPLNPSLGSLSVSGTVVSVGTIPAPSCPADVTTTGTSNGIPDGSVDISDFSFYLTLWAAGDAAADVTTTGTSNGIPDGSVDVSDYSLYLTLWAAGCP